VHVDSGRDRRDPAQRDRRARTRVASGSASRPRHAVVPFPARGDLMSGGPLASFFAPRTLAIVGLSSKPYGVSRLTLRALRRGGWEGKLVGINPNLDDV